MANWAEMPVITTRAFRCKRCKDITPHHCCTYSYIEFRVCIQCKTQTQWIPEGKNPLQSREEQTSARQAVNDIKPEIPRFYKLRTR